MVIKAVEQNESPNTDLPKWLLIYGKLGGAKLNCKSNPVQEGQSSKSDNLISTLKKIEY